MANWQVRKYPVSTDEDLELVKSDLKAGSDSGWDVKHIVNQNGNIIVFARKD